MWQNWILKQVERDMIASLLLSAWGHFENDEVQFHVRPPMCISHGLTDICNSRIGQGTSATPVGCSTTPGWLLDKDPVHSAVAVVLNVSACHPLICRQLNISRTSWNTENSSDCIHCRMYSILWYPDSGLWYPDEIVRNHVAPFVQNHGPGIVLQYDGAHPHGARVVQNELQVRNTTPCPGQPFSPTSLAEHVLDELKCWLQ